MVQIKQWDDLKDNYHKGSLLLGNGSSIAVDNCFNYSSLYEEAVRLGYLTQSVQAVFDKFQVNDFELVLRRLWQAKLVNEALGIPPGEVGEAYKRVQKALIETIRATHVTFDEASQHLTSIYKFMQLFQIVVSLNYDLIVYWAMLLGNDELGRWFKDGFMPRHFDDDWSKFLKPYEKTKGATFCVFPHGNLCLRIEGFSGQQKITKTRDEKEQKIPLLDVILNRWEKDSLAPLFVCEGLKENKLKVISGNDYLERIFYEVIPSLSETLVVYGWGFAEQDEHIVKKISQSGVRKVAVSVYGDDQVLCGNVERILDPLNLDELVFFDAQSDGCWNNPPLIELGKGDKIASVAVIKQ